jgi:hypothetical protein
MSAEQLSRAPYPVGDGIHTAADGVPTATDKPSVGRGVERRPSAEGPESVFRMLKDIGFTLHVGPTMALCIPFFVFFSVLAGFIEYYVLSTTAHFAIFIVGSYMVFSSYFVANYFMCNNSKSYNEIPDDKRFYVLSNLIKSAVLLAYCPLAARTLYHALVYDEWSTPRIRQLGVLYAIPDFVSMLLVHRMALSTKIHHLCVVVFMVVNLFSTYEEETVGRALVVYAIFSTFAYLVNMLLASRFLPVTPKTSFLLSVLAFIVYAGCLGVNWTWQLAFCGRLGATKPSFGLVVYIALITLIVYDDCILVKWLWRNIFRQASLVRAADAEDAKKSEGKAKAT